MLVLLAKKGFFLLDKAHALVYTSDTLTTCRYGDRSSIGRALDCGSSGCGFKSHRPPSFWPTIGQKLLSGGEDLNLRPLEPHSSALPDCATARIDLEHSKEGRPQRPPFFASERLVL